MKPTRIFVEALCIDCLELASDFLVLANLLLEILEEFSDELLWVYIQIRI